MNDGKRIGLAIMGAILCILTLSCFGVYDGLLGLSPGELLERSEVVALGNFVSTDTIAVIADAEYDFDTCQFVVVEYTFQPTKMFKGRATKRYIRLWNFDKCCDTSCIDHYGLIAGKEYLVYGNAVSSSAELSEIACPTMLFYDEGYRFEDRNRADSLLSANLPRSEELSVLLTDKGQDAVVLGGTDYNLRTMYLYSSINLAFWDSKRGVQEVSRQEYLIELEQKAREGQRQ